MKNTAGLLRGGKKGNKGGSGRPPEWLRDKCQDIIDREKLIEFLGNVAAGKPLVHKISIVGDGKNPDKVFQKTIESADMKDRVKAVELLLDRGFGKPSQALEVSGEVGSYVIELPKQDLGKSGNVE